MSLGQPNVLAIDDDVQFLEIAKNYLQDIAHVEIASSGRMAVQLAQEIPVETVIDTFCKKTEKGNKKTVVAIDDDMSYLKQINNFLNDKYHVVMINSARLALNYLSNHVPDIILLDYQMPLFNGVTLMKLIQQNSSCQHVPFIILSGTLDIEAVKGFCPIRPKLKHKLS